MKRNIYHWLTILTMIAIAGFSMWKGVQVKIEDMERINVLEARIDSLLTLDSCQVRMYIDTTGWVADSTFIRIIPKYKKEPDTSVIMYIFPEPKPKKQGEVSYE